MISDKLYPAERAAADACGTRIACRLRLGADDAAHAALENIGKAYFSFLAFMDGQASLAKSFDLATLHRQFYEKARATFPLPAQMVVLGLKDWARRRQGRAGPLASGAPLDGRLFAIKGVASISVSTVNGRLWAPYRFEGYERAPAEPFPARLLAVNEGFEILVDTGDSHPSLPYLSEEGASARAHRHARRLQRAFAALTDADASLDCAREAYAMVETTLAEAKEKLPVLLRPPAADAAPG